MSGVGPGDPTLVETYARLANLIHAEEEEHGKIAEMSQESLREWLNDFLIGAAATLGIAVAKVAAAVMDYVQIGRNVVETAKSEFRNSYTASRRIGPVGE